MQNTAPSRSLARHARQLLLASYLVVAVGIFFAAVGLVLFLVPVAAPGTAAAAFVGVAKNVLLVLGVLIALVGGGIAIRALTRRRENEVAYQVGAFLKSYLDERYRFIRNINRPGLGYIDAVLVGPPGVLVFRVMNPQGTFFNEKAGWLRQTRSKEWTPTRVNPTKEAIVDIKAMRDMLTRHALSKVDVYGVVVFTTRPPAFQFTSREPTVPATYLNDLVNVLSSNYLAKERISAREVKAITDLLLDV